MSADAMDAAQAAAEANTDDAIAAHLAQREADARRQRIEESHRPMVPDEELRCLGCDDLIGVARLKIFSRARLCTPCAADNEALLKKELYL